MWKPENDGSRFTKNFRVILSNSSGGAVFGTRTNVFGCLTDNDSPLKVDHAGDVERRSGGSR